MMNKKQKPKKQLLRVLSVLMLSSILNNHAFAQKQVLIINEEKALVVKVAKNGAVRISVKGDRLQDVMGLEESVSFEKDETHGFLYLRGIDRKQTITVITEGGTLQDLTLEPDNKNLSTGVCNVVLKSKDYVEEDSSLKKTSFEDSLKLNSMHPFQQTMLPNNSFQDTVIMVMKQLHLSMGRGMGTMNAEELQAIGERPTTHGVSAKPLRQIKSQGLIGIVFEVVNDTGTTINLLEKDFYRTGDYALAIGKKQLEESEKTLLIVIHRG